MRPAGKPAGRRTHPKKNARTLEAHPAIDAAASELKQHLKDMAAKKRGLTFVDLLIEKS